jgi:hypothetical protein
MNWRQYRTIEQGEFLLFSVDTAAGGGDYTTCQVISKTKIDVPLVFQSKVTTSDFIPDLVRILEKAFDLTKVKPIISLERNNGGAFLIDRVALLNYAGKYELFKMPKFGNINHEIDETLYGWNMTTATRPKALQELKDAIDHRLFKVYDRQTINEMLSFVVMQTSSSWKAQAEVGAHDDLVMALAISWQMYQICEPVKSKSDYSEYENYKQEGYEEKGLRI